MAVGWMTVLKLVPWGDVIENAPKVAQGAKKLWNSVGKHAPVPTTSPVVAADDPHASVDALQRQVAELQTSVAQLHQQMVQSSALITSLAGQNTALIRRVQLLRYALMAVGLILLGLLSGLLMQWFQ